MKAILVLVTLFFSYHLFSQDSIITRSGQVIPAKVNEVTQTEVKYRKPSNPDGPLYVMSKSDVVVIEYKNGTKDVFQSSDNSNTNNTNNHTQQVQQVPQQNYYNNNYVPRPNVNIVVGTPAFGFGGYYPYGGFYRPYPRFYGGFGYGGYGGGYCHPHYWRHW
jgi:hypothetical protein